MLELSMTSYCRRRGFTFIELLVICLLVGLTGALVVPRISGTSRRIAVEQALSSLRQVFDECAMIARAGGKTIELVLDTEDNCFTVGQIREVMDRDWRPVSANSSSGDDGEAPGNAGGILGGADSYDVPGDIEWEELPELGEDDTGYVFCFFPDGEASGPQLPFCLKNEHYLLGVDSVTGQVDIRIQE